MPDGTAGAPLARPRIVIEMFADTICPWCLIGRRRLARALDEAGLGELRSAGVEIRWRAFQLNPAMPREGMERSRYLSAKFGGPEAAQRIYAAIERAALTEGLSLNFGRIARTPNTLDSHRLIMRAAAAGLQEEAVEAVMRAYFVDGLDVGDRDVLSDIAAQIGLPPAEARSFLESRDGVKRVVDDEQRGRRLGISGVPFFLFNDRYAIAGVQPPEVLHQITALCS